MLVFLLGTNCTRHGLGILAYSFATAFANRLLACHFEVEALSKLAIPWFFDDFFVVNDRLSRYSFSCNGNREGANGWRASCFHGRPLHHSTRCFVPIRAGVADHMTSTCTTASHRSSSGSWETTNGGCTRWESTRCDENRCVSMGWDALGFGGNPCVWTGCDRNRCVVIRCDAF